MRRSISSERSARVCGFSLDHVMPSSWGCTRSHASWKCVRRPASVVSPFVLELRAPEHAGDSLVITGADVGDIRLVDTWVTLRITNGERARQLIARSAHRI